MKKQLTILLLIFGFANATYADPSEQETIDYINKKIECSYKSGHDYTTVGRYYEDIQKRWNRNLSLDNSFIKYSYTERRKWGGSRVRNGAHAVPYKTEDSYTFIKLNHVKNVEFKKEFYEHHFDYGKDTSSGYKDHRDARIILNCDLQYNKKGCVGGNKRGELNPHSTYYVIGLCGDSENKERTIKAFKHLIKLIKTKYPPIAPIEKKELF